MSDLRSDIRRGRDLDREIKAKQEELKRIKAKLIAVGPGSHAGTDGAAAVVTFPAASLEAEPDAAAVEKARAAVGDVYFKRVFAQTIVHKPIKGFREIIRALLDAGPAHELIAAFEKPSAPQVRFS